MKLNKNFVQITVTALVSSAASFIFISTVKPDLSAIILPESEVITWEVADDYRKQYLDHKPLFVQYWTDEGVEVIDTLEGFVFEAAHLDEIINDNHSASGDPDKVVFFLGQDDKFTQGSGLFDKKRGNMRMIAAGVQDGQILIDATTGLAPSIYDRADPCPPMCPN